MSLIAQVDEKSGGYKAGVWFGRLFLLLVVIGLILTFTRKDMSWKDKLFGWGNKKRPPEGPEDQERLDR